MGGSTYDNEAEIGANMQDPEEHRLDLVSASLGVAMDIQTTYPFRRHRQVCPIMIS